MGQVSMMGGCFHPAVKHSGAQKLALRQWTASAGAAYNHTYLIEPRRRRRGDGRRIVGRGVMRILLINPPHPSIGSRIPREHLPPLGLLAVGGPLIDAGHDLRLIDAEFGPLTIGAIVEQALTMAPAAILLGHSGSTSGHPVIADLTRALRAALPNAWIIYGGVFPTYHWREILVKEPQIDFIVRGEGEETGLRLIQALEAGTALHTIPGIAYRAAGQPVATPSASPIRDLNAYRVGWELVDLSRYSYWGDRRAVVVQFSRGCPHGCSYCGQRVFWTRWRHRDPRQFAAELAWLHRVHGVEVVNFEREKTASPAEWAAICLAASRPFVER